MKAKMTLATLILILTAFSAQVYAVPHLMINGAEHHSMRDPDQNINFDFDTGHQTWSLLAEYSGWDETNSFGYYTGGQMTTIFSGPDAPVTNVNTGIKSGTQLGLWLWADKNENGIYDSSDPMLCSQRDWHPTTGTKYNSYQYFYVYDVRQYKNTRASYYFDNDHEDFEAYGDFDYLIYIDDSGVYTSDKDHNDMIVGVKTSVVPEPTTLMLIGLGLTGIIFCRKRFV